MAKKRAPRSCYIDPKDRTRYRVFRLICEGCREKTPHRLCLEPDPSNLRIVFPVLVCEKCELATRLTTKEHDKVLAGEYRNE